MKYDEDRLIGDFEIARLLSVSRSWVRQQRFKKNHGQPHCFDVDPVMVGCCPRYVASEVTEWMGRLREARETDRSACEAYPNVHAEGRQCRLMISAMVHAARD